MFGWSASNTSSLISNHDNRNSQAMLMYIFEFIVIWKCRQKVRFKWFKCFLIHLYLTRQCLTFGFIHCIHFKVWKVKGHLLLVSVNIKPIINSHCLFRLIWNGEISVALTFMKYKISKVTKNMTAQKWRAYRAIHLEMRWQFFIWAFYMNNCVGQNYDIWIYCNSQLLAVHQLWKC